MDADKPREGYAPADDHETDVSSLRRPVDTARVTPQEICVLRYAL
jgi:hypothetical protein